MRFTYRLCLAIGLLCSVQSQAATELPDKLSFETAMKIADEGNSYQALMIQADYEDLTSELLKISGTSDVNISLVALAQYVEPSVSRPENTNDDHKVSVLLTKQLMDFGFSDEKIQSAQARLDSVKLMMEQMRLTKRIEVARKFFDIKLADLQFNLDNEAISTAYIKFHKTEERNELKQSSDVELLQAQFEYQQVRARRYESETMQRISRASFAESIARPKDLPADVIVPDISFISRNRPEFEDVLKLAMENNLQLRAQKFLVEAAQRELAASRKEGGSTLSTEVEWAEYSYEMTSRSNWRAALKYSVPLYENDSVKSLRAKAMATVQKQKAKQIQIESEIRQQCLEVWQRIYVLKAKQDTDVVAEEYRELYQDRSRAFYEMEFRTDLGDSFTRVSEAKLEKFKNNFELVMSWMKLAMLTGSTLEEYIQQ